MSISHKSIARMIAKELMERSKKASELKGKPFGSDKSEWLNFSG